MLSVNVNQVNLVDSVIWIFYIPADFLLTNNWKKGI